MQLAVHEAQDLHELAMSCVNSITNMACFINQAQDAELKGLLQKHFPLHIQDYNMKADYLGNAQGASSTLQVPNLNPILQSYTSAPAAAIPVTPRTSVQQFNDREIATAYLLTLKRSGREYAWAAMEMSNPEIRTFLEKAFQMSSHHAYDVWQWMVKKGYYPLEAATPATMASLGSLYQKVQEPVMMH
ncbi:spore coat protein [Paenibacillus caui]|uniref:spore coat protein n=1 Tax=Paenibacillus caui TaxID=2873927 RepID=UPI001CA96EF5|nr:spore coat protein [Paenibacillus caui]